MQCKLFRAKFFKDISSQFHLMFNFIYMPPDFPPACDFITIVFAVQMKDGRMEQNINYPNTYNPNNFMDVYGQNKVMNVKNLQ